MSSEIDAYLSEIDKSETHITHLLNLLSRIHNSWQVLSRIIIKLSNNLQLEDRNKVITIAAQFEGLLQEFGEMVETILSDRINIISAVSQLIQWVYKSFEPKK